MPIETNENIIDISHIDKVQLLIALYNAAINESEHSPYLFYNQPPSPAQELSQEEAERHLNFWRFSISAIKGKRIFIDFSGDTINVEQYNEINGNCRAQVAIAQLMIIYSL